MSLARNARAPAPAPAQGKLLSAAGGVEAGPRRAGAGGRTGLLAAEIGLVAGAPPPPPPVLRAGEPRWVAALCRSGSG